MPSLLPTQPAGPGPTDAPLPSYQSYSPYTTTVYVYTTTATRIAYDPAGSAAPSLTEEVSSVHTTSTGYRVVNVPLLYDGPLPAPPLGTGYTLPGGGGSTAGQSETSSSTANASPTQPAGGNGGNNSPSQGGGTQDGGSSPSEGGGDGTGAGSASAGGNGDAGSTIGNGAGSTNGNGNGHDNGHGAGSSAGSSSSSGDGGSGGTNAGSGAGSNTGDANGGTNSGTNSGSGQSGGAANSSVGGDGGQATAAGTDGGASPTAAGSDGAEPTATQSPSAGSGSGSSGGGSFPSSSSSGLSPTGGPSGTSTAPSPTASISGNTAQDRLSDGQIAGIALGALAAVFLLLLLFLCCARRRNRRAQDRAAGGAGAGTATTHNIGRSFSNFGRKGRYAFLGAGAAAGAAAAAGRGSIHSDEWEEDHLSGGDGSGFFVVGGRRTTGGSVGRRSGSLRSLASMHNVPSSNDSGAGGRGLAALGAGLGAGGLVAAALGRNKSKRKPVPQMDTDDDDDDDPFADGSVDPDAEILHGDGHGEMAERRGLMDFGSPDERYYAPLDAPDAAGEMSQVGPEGWGAATLGAIGAAAASTDRDGRPEMSQSGSSGGAMGHRYSSSAGGGYTSGSVTGSGSGSGAASGSGGGRGSSSGSTGARTGASLPPPPRAPRDRSSPADSPTDARVSMDTNGSSNSGLGLAVAAAAGAGGLTALASAHRESHGSTYSKGYYPSDSSAEQQDRHSRFISHDTALLGPAAHQSSDDEDSLAPMHTYGNLASGPHPVLGRLSTIRSVGDMGERGSSSERAQSSHGGSAIEAPAHAPAHAPALPNVSPGVGPGRSGGFFTPTTSPRQNAHLSLRSTGSGSYSAQHWRASQDDDERAEEESIEREASGHSSSAGAAPAGLLGSVSTGWQRLTLNPYSWLPGSRDSPAPPHEQDESVAPTSERNMSVQHLPQTSHQTQASDTRSERASVYGPSALGHASSGSPQVSREVSINSSRSPALSQPAGAGPEFGLLGAAAGEAQQNTNSSGSSRERAGADGYVASVSSESPSLRSRSSGVDSLSQHPHASSNGSGSSSMSQASSGSTRSRSTGGLSGASTGAASYSPSHLTGAGPGTRSSRGRGSFTGSSRAAYATGPSGAPSLSGASQSLTTGSSSDAQSSQATAGGSNGSAPHEADQESSLQRLSSVSERAADEGPYTLEPEEDVFGTPPQGHFPSTSLGAAMRRQARRERERESSASPEDALFGTTPTQGTVHGGEPSSGSTHTWRESPRVSAISQRAERAAAAAAHLEQSRLDAFAQAQAGLGATREPSGDGAVPIAIPPAAPWGSLESTFTPSPPPAVPPSPRTASRLRNVQNEAELGEASGGEDDEDDPDRTLRAASPRGATFEWPRFLRF